MCYYINTYSINDAKKVARVPLASAYFLGKHKVKIRQVER